MVLDLEIFLRSHLLPFSSDPVEYRQSEVLELIGNAERLLLSEPSLLELQPPIVVAGNIQGQFMDLLAAFTVGRWPPQSNWLFLGDYVDRGPRSLECICFLLALKLRYPGKVFLLRGNHESSDMNRIYGFERECIRRVSSKAYKGFQRLFNAMPLAARIGARIFCVHGGLSPELKRVDDIDRIKRPLEVPRKGLICDLLWADPSTSRTVTTWGEKQRNLSYVFGPKIIDHFFQENNLSLIVRSHQVVKDGYQFYVNQKLLTIFSAANYGAEFDNKAAILDISEKLVCTIKVIQSERFEDATGHEAVEGRSQDITLDTSRQGGQHQK